MGGCSGQSRGGAPDASVASGGSSTGSGGSATNGVGAVPMSNGGGVGAGGVVGVGGVVNGGGSTGTGGAMGSGGTGCDVNQCVPISCPQGQVAALLAGGCCRQTCVASDGSSDAGARGHEPPAVPIDAGACVRSPAPGCSGNTWPYCTPDWQTAMSWYMTCPNPFSDAYLGTCGGMNAIVVSGPYDTRAFLYDHLGRLSGFLSVGGSTAHCEAYLPDFNPPTEACTPLGSPCYDAGAPQLPGLSGLDAGAIVTWQGGAPDCKTGQAAYDDYLTSQLAQYDSCVSDQDCLNNGAGPGADLPSNRCVQPCDLFVSMRAANSQIIYRLNQFGNLACARCETGPQAACPSTIPFSGGKCVNHRCVSQN
jgi:hypothetical protein